jgi:hypothetical protein
MMKIDTKDIQMGFWLGVGLLLLSVLVGLITRAWSAAAGGLGQRDGG